MDNRLAQILNTDKQRTLGNTRAAADRIWSRPLHRNYTDHTVAHSERVVALLDGLTEGVTLSPGEVLILLAAAYLHDIGMQNERFARDDPSSGSGQALEEIRAIHHEITAEMIYQAVEDPAQAIRLGLPDDPGLVEAIALVAKGHRKVDLNTNEYDPFTHGDETIRLRLLAALLRFADELDIDHRRVNLELLKVMRVPDDSKLHWWKCHYVSGVNIVDGYIRVAYRFPRDRPDYEGLLIPLVETDMGEKLADLEEIFWANGVKVALGKPQVRMMRLVQPLPAEVEELARQGKVPGALPPSKSEQEAVTPAREPEPPPQKTEYHFHTDQRPIDTGGGTYVEGKVDTGGGDLVGRDQFKVGQVVFNVFAGSDNLRKLCSALDVDYESLSGDTEADKVGILVGHLHQVGQLGDLVKAGQQLRPDIRWDTVLGEAQKLLTREDFEPETVYIPAGPFWMGSPEGEGVAVWETPQQEVDLSAYWIGKYPVTNEQYAEFVRRTGRIVPPAAGWEGQIPPADRLEHPVSGVTWYDALAYCEWLSEQTGRHYSLPSEAQWEKAARGTNGRIYPWGDEWDPGCCNHGGEGTTAVDAYPEGESPYGCYDMVGNVREWTRTVWGHELPSPEFRYPWTNDRREDLTASRYMLRVYRGGDADRVEELRCSARGAHFPDKPGPPRKRHGFRIVLLVA